ncbi:MAG: PHP domain-containing protein [Gemmatimonadales bacterium]|nr:PHP domain-containing protein [Gemmatimonadales bacterium]
MHLDLHLHSTCSDGSLAPAALVQAARRAGLHAIALTDHDTTAGISPARRAAGADGGPIVIAGVELTSSLDGAEVHLLGYGVDPDHVSLAAFTDRAARARNERMAAIVSRLQALGVGITLEDVTVEAGCVSVGRPHIARALVRVGAVPNFQEAFNRYIRDGAPAFVPSHGPDVREAIVAVREAGGCSVWAHPRLEDIRSFGPLAAIGLDGIEVLRPSVEPAVSIALEQEARGLGLLITGGSDWHGGTRPALGSWFVTEKHVRAFLDRMKIPV